MHKSNSDFQLAELIYKFVSGTITDEENEALTEWRSKTVNEELFKKIADSDAILNKFEIYKQIDSHSALARVKARITEKPQGKTIPLFTEVLRYAAIFVILFGAGYMFYQKYQGRNQNNQNYTVNNSGTSQIAQIKPGTKKAILILVNGEKIDLTQQKHKLIQLPGIVIKNEDNLLSYENAVDSNNRINKGQITYNTLYVPIGGEYQVQLPDGSKVWLNSASSLKYPVKFDTEQRIVQLEGEAYFEVNRGSKHFIVKAGDVEVKVLGTKFNLNAYADDEVIATTLVEGKVGMIGKNIHDEAVLTPDKQAVYNRNNNNIIVRPVDTEKYIAWKDGKFYFEKEDLGKILIRLARWYDIEVQYEHPSLKLKTFTGMALKDRPIDYILNLINKTSNVDYRINNKKIIIMKRN